MNKQRAGALVFLIVGLYGTVRSLMLPMGKWGAPGAGAYPLIVSILLTLSGVVIFLRERTVERIDWREILKQQWAPLQIIVFTGGFIFSLERLGYTLTAILYTFALLFFVSRYRPWKAIWMAILIGVGSWFVFGKLFETQLPEGILGF
jgi:putative tricarboxylic transport membrane protein